MSDEGERTCPLCTEEMDLTDQQLKPCKCGYEICVWCWHHIINMAEKDDMEGRCPACRAPYDKERIVGMASNCERVVAEVNADKRHKSHKAKPKTSAEARKHLSSVRVIQRNLVYIIGLPSNLADESMLKHREYFGQYGKVLKVSISRPASGAQQSSNSNTFSVYITYAKEEEAVRCIQVVHNFVLEGKPLRACFGTTKYCHTWLRNMTCNNPDCLYLHDIGSQEDSFTKDEIISAYTRSRVPQIASINLQRRSGSLLPPPADDFCNVGTASASKLVVKDSSDTKDSPPNCCGVGGSTILPTAASWGLRANCLPPAASTTSLQGSARQKIEIPNNSSVLSSMVASAKHFSAWHDVLSTPKTAEESRVMHLDDRCRPLESSKSVGRDSRTAVSNSSAEIAHIKPTSAWYDDGITSSTHLDGRSNILESSKSISKDSRTALSNSSAENAQTTKLTSSWYGKEITTSKVPEESHVGHLSARSRPLEPSKLCIGNDTQTTVSNSSPEITDTNQTSAWDNDIIPSLKISEENHAVPSNGRPRSLVDSKSSSCRDSHTSISNFLTEIVLDTTHTSVTSMRHSSISAAPEGKDRDFVVPENNTNLANLMCVEELGRLSLGAGPNKVTDCYTAVNRNMHNLHTGFPLLNIDNHLEVSLPIVDGHRNSVSDHGLTGLRKTPASLLQQFYPEHGIGSSTSLPSSKDTVRSADAHISRELSDWTSESRKQVLTPTGSKMGGITLIAEDHRHIPSDVINQLSYLPFSTQSSHPLDPVTNPPWNSDFGSTHPSVNGDSRTLGVKVNDTLLPFGNDNISSNGHNESKFCGLASGEEVKYLGRLNDPSNVEKAANVDLGESSIISNILSMDFDPWNDSLISANNFAQVLSETDGQNGSLKMCNSWKVQNKNQSRFSFARQESKSTFSEPSFSEVVPAPRNSSITQDPLGEGLQNCFTAPGLEDPIALINRGHSVISSDKTTAVSKAKTSVPPGFSVPSRTPPPGFSSQDRLDKAYDTTFSDNLRLGSSSLRNQFQVPLNENAVDVEFIDPAILAVGKGRLPLGVNNSGLGLRSSFPTQLSASQGQGDPRRQLLMQQSISTHQDLRFSDHIGDRVLALNDSYTPSRHVVQNHSSLSPFAQMPLQPSMSSHVSGTQWDGWNDIQSGSDMGMTDVLRNERFGLNKYFTGTEELKSHIPSSGDLFNRAFGM